MTPKEKAIELVLIFKQRTSYREVFHTIELLDKFHNNAINCALILVNKIIESNPLEPNNTPDWLQPEDWFSDANISAEKYWQEVKKEIEAL